MGDSCGYIACDKCDFRQTLWVSGKRDTFAESIYCFDNGHISPVFKNKWWCHRCESVKDVEQIPSNGDVQNHLADIYTSLSDDKARRFLGRPTIEYYQRILAGSETWTQWARARKDPRCLTCGSQELTPIGLMNRNTMGRLDVAHPNCGGNLYLGEREMGIRASHPRKNNTTPIEYVRFAPDGLPIKESAAEEKPSSSGPSVFAWLAVIAAIALFYFAS